MEELPIFERITLPLNIKHCFRFKKTHFDFLLNAYPYIKEIFVLDLVVNNKEICVPFCYEEDMGYYYTLHDLEEYDLYEYNEAEVHAIVKALKPHKDLIMLEPLLYKVKGLESDSSTYISSSGNSVTYIADNVKNYKEFKRKHFDNGFSFVICQPEREHMITFLTVIDDIHARINKPHEGLGERRIYKLEAEYYAALKKSGINVYALVLRDKELSALSINILIERKETLSVVVKADNSLEYSGIGTFMNVEAMKFGLGINKGIDYLDENCSTYKGKICDISRATYTLGG